MSKPCSMRSRGVPRSAQSDEPDAAHVDCSAPFSSLIRRRGTRRCRSVLRMRSLHFRELRTDRHADIRDSDYMPVLIPRAPVVIMRPL